MVTTEQLRKQIERQKNVNMGIKEMRELSKEKERLELEFNMLKGENKPKTSWSKIGGELKGIGNKIIKVANESRKDLEAKNKQGGLGLFK